MKIHFNKVKDSILNVKLDKRTEVFNWGLDNSFPSLIEILVNHSVTSKNCINKVAKAIYGKSFGKIGNIIINSDGQTLNEVLRIASREYAKHNNVFFHITYNGELRIKAIKVIPATSVRVGKSDDLGYSGKFIVYDNWNKENGKIDADKFRVYDKFNPLKNVIEAQIEKAGSILNYKGQILHLQKDTNSIYSLPDLFAVQNEALLQKNSQIFRANGAERGFLNNKVIVVQPFANDDDRRTFKNTIKEIQGAENAGTTTLLESSQMADDLSNQFKVEDLTSNYNDKLFEYSDKQAKQNITEAFGVPLILVDTSSDGMFGNSGEMLKQAKLQLWESREEERNQIEEIFQKLMSNYAEPIEGELIIINPNQRPQKYE
ncbi:hypothetical protein BA195_10150 [Tenacibaculum soleae]|uniref:Phage portal protein n=1 Tax=Tenacibaculum soleae TaxID=447689 RepID=A0A1B9XY79_9FLAO|nr:phage portal protein [Tenacibaculum soleae]OCK42528.1 hypothetical protein BA195_10150 [Tenacibaculum soleae]